MISFVKLSGEILGNRGCFAENLGWNPLAVALVEPLRI